MNLEEAIAFAEADMEEVGADFVYNPGGEMGCYYISQQDPRFPPKILIENPAEGSKTHGCQVGRILERAGLMTDLVAESIMGIADVPLPDVSDDAITFLNQLQEQQDGGESVGDSLAFAKRFAAEWGLS